MKVSKDNDTAAKHREQVKRGYFGTKDHALSRRVAFCGPADHPYHFTSLRWLCRALEYTGHGVPWFILTIGYASISLRPEDMQFWTNMVWALIIDLVVVAVTKAIVRRTRPDYATQLRTIPFSPDAFSFPSGHASRAVMMTTLFCTQWIAQFSYQCLFITWATAICLSRAVLGRHFVGDIIAGALLGLLLAAVHITYLWLDLKTCFWILWPLHEYFFI